MYTVTGLTRKRENVIKSILEVEVRGIIRVNMTALAKGLIH